MEDIAASFHGSFSEMNGVLVLHWIGPAKVVVPCISSNITKNSTSVPFSLFAGAPDVIDKFMVVKGEIARHIPMPFGKFHAPTQVQLVVLPDTNHGGHDLDG